MEDIAELGLAIRSDPLVVARDRLKGFEDQAGRADRAAKGLEATTALLTRAMGLLGAALSINQLIRLTSTWTDLNSRVRNVVGSHEAAAVAMERIDEMARRTYSSLEQTAETFLRNAKALEELGYSTNQTFDFVESLNNALVVSGAKGERAEQVMNALSRAIGLGKLSGDNLNTVLATGGRVAEALADGLGVTTLELRKLGTEGKLTTDQVIKALTSQLEQLRAEADAMPATIQDAFVLLNNALLATVGKLDEATGASMAIAEAIILVGDNADLLIPIIGGLAAVLATALVPSLVAATIALAALVATPVGALAVGIGLVTAAFVNLWNEQRLADQVMSSLNASVDENQRAIDDAAASSGTFTRALRDQIAMQVEAARAALAEADAQTIAARTKAAKERIGFGATVFGGSISAQEADAALKKSLELDALYQTLEAQLARIDAGVLVDPVKPRGGEGGSAGSKAAEKARKAYDDLVLGSRQFIEQQELEAQTLGMTSEAANRLRYEQELLAEAARSNIALGPEQRNQIADLADEMARAEERTRALTETFDFYKGTFRGFFADMKSGLQDGMSAWEALGNAGANALDRIADRALGMAADGLFDMLFGAVMGGLTGGIGGGGVTGGAWGNGLWGSAIFSANGNVFESPGLSSYSNQIVNSPTVFPFARGIGLMGEAGPEAIMPLRRGLDGRLGVDARNDNRGAANSNSPAPVTLLVQVNGATGGDDLEQRAYRGAQRALNDYRRWQFHTDVEQHLSDPLARG